MPRAPWHAFQGDKNHVITDASFHDIFAFTPLALLILFFAFAPAPAVIMPLRYDATRRRRRYYAIFDLIRASETSARISMFFHIFASFSRFFAAIISLR